MSRVLVIEDHPNIQLGIRKVLELEGHEVIEATDGVSGLARARADDPDLIILDLMLPGFSGQRVLRTLREDGSNVPVLILTARGEEMDKVQGLQLGADDYVTKPFGRHELAARVGALLRRARIGRAEEAPPATAAPATERFGSVEVSFAARSVARGSTPVALTPKEFDLLAALLRRKGAVATRIELLQEVWGHRAAVLTRTVDVHMAMLRNKLEEDPANPRHLITVRKAGYRFEP